MEMDNGWSVRTAHSQRTLCCIKGKRRSLEVLSAIASEAIFLVALSATHLDCQSPPPARYGRTRRVTPVRPGERDSKPSPLVQ
jgi:hypothetical protein